MLRLTGVNRISSEKGQIHSSFSDTRKLILLILDRRKQTNKLDLSMIALLT